MKRYVWVILLMLCLIAAGWGLTRNVSALEGAAQTEASVAATAPADADVSATAAAPAETEASAPSDTLDITYRADDSPDTQIRLVQADGATYLFLPASASKNALRLYADTDSRLTATGDAGRSVTFQSGEAWDFASLYNGEPEDGCYPLLLSAEDGRTRTLTVLFSANIRSLYLLSGDPENEGRDWLDDCDKHEKSTTGRMVLLRADGSTAYHGELSEIRGRGNTTWGNYPLDANTVITVDKKPYQIKLEEKADLLDTGEKSEANKTWTLAADYFDGTLLRNRFSLDLARELGETEASGCAPVDLYYDGVYRGTYLLAEKVGVDEGRVDVEDYDKILKKLNNKAGISLQTLMQVTGTNRYGSTFTATGGVEDADSVALGGYLIEMDQSYYDEQRAHFALTDGTIFTVRNPEYASESMMSYISELFEEANASLNHYGTNPETGKSWTEYFDTDSILPFYWINQLAKNPDIWYSSTYMWLSEGSQVIHLGPVWDFDIAYSLRARSGFSTSDGYVGDDRTWGNALATIPAFQKTASAYFTETLWPLVQNVLLGDEDAHGEVLHSLAWYWQEESASRRMNDILWDPVSLFDSVTASTYEQNYENLRTFLSDRIDWLKSEIESWPEEAQATRVEITLTAPYADVEEGMTLTMDDLHTNVAMPQMELSVETDATETEDAVWRADITIGQKPGVAISDSLEVLVNGAVIPFTRNQDGSISLSVLFADPSYRVADYDDTDYGLVFNPDYYAERYPEVVAEVGDDPEALLAYYVENGMAEGQVANAFFDPAEILAKIPDVQETVGEATEDLVWFFTEAGYTDWMSQLEKTFTPEVWAADS